MFDFVHFILIQSSLSYNHIYRFCITLLLYWVFIYSHYFIDLTVASLSEKFETEFPLIINCKSLLPAILICVALKRFSVIQERNYISVNRPLCVLHTIFKIRF